MVPHEKPRGMSCNVPTPEVGSLTRHVAAQSGFPMPLSEASMAPPYPRVRRGPSQADRLIVTDRRFLAMGSPDKLHYPDRHVMREITRAQRLSGIVASHNTTLQVLTTERAPLRLGGTFASETSLIPSPFIEMSQLPFRLDTDRPYRNLHQAVDVTSRLSLATASDAILAPRLFTYVRGMHCLPLTKTVISKGRLYEKATRPFGEIILTPHVDLFGVLAYLHIESHHARSATAVMLSGLNKADTGRDQSAGG
ncbi:hypothetical protein CIB48_g720 [Xylaria polymorpha]|nr:hypothetical protein CIB48_g720 [Xylaria polymorpha]